MFCPRCQNEVNEDMNYCPHCGYPMKHCPYCHHLIQDDDLYCPTCGKMLHKASQDDIGGYYEPLFHDGNDNHHEHQKTFKDIPVNQKVNKVVVLVSVIVLVILSVLSYEYIEHGPSLTPETSKTTLPRQEMTISGQTDQSSLIGNQNQNGQAYFDGKNLYLCDLQGNLILMDQNLNQQKTLLSKKCENLIVHNNTIYYTDTNNHFCEMSTDGQNQKTILSKAVYYPYLDNQQLYYQLDEDQESLYVYNLESKKETKLNDRPTYCINVVDDMIYYLSKDGIYRIRKDGKNDEKLLSGTFDNVIYSQGKLYYLSTEGICAFDIESQKVSVIKELVASFINMNDQYLFYQSMDGSVERYDLKTQEEKTIYNGLVEIGYIVGDKLIVETSVSLYTQDSYAVVMDFDGTQQQRLFFDGQGDYI